MASRTAIRFFLSFGAIVGLGLTPVIGQGVPNQNQGASAKALAFEVVSIKRNGDERRLPRFDLRAARNGRITVEAMSLGDLIRFAYPDFGRRHQLEGGPAWLLTERFDVIATFSPEVMATAGPADRPTGRLPEPLLEMLRAMLGDRFKLKVRSESREVPIYALILARRDGRLGRNLRLSTADCTRQTVGGEICGIQGDSFSRLRGIGVPISALVSSLSLAPDVDRQVEDQTGLTGTFDFTLEMTEQTDAGGPVRRLSTFALAEEQLGLRLESRRGKMGVLIVEQAEPPTPN